ncbi:hypothetical protein SprV_0301202300 [Sparganum proliferum]
MQTHPYTNYVDQTKAFDTMSREGLWEIMRKFGCPEYFAHVVCQPHDGVMVRVTDNGAISEAFTVTNGTNQGCALPPTTLSLMFSAMLMDACRNGRPGIRIECKTDGHLLKSRRRRTPTRLSTNTFHDRLFADNCALNSTTEEDMQRARISSPPAAPTLD